MVVRYKRSSKQHLREDTAKEKQVVNEAAGAPHRHRFLIKFMKHSGRFGAAQQGNIHLQRVGGGVHPGGLLCKRRQTGVKD